MATLSVVISVYNGERFLRDCLSSVKGIADEIIVVDHESTDTTIKIAKEFTKKIYSQKNNPDDIDRQKNFGFEKATKDWVLSLDADEQLTEELRTELREVLSKQDISAYWIPRRNIIFGKWVEYTGWYPDYQLRLFKKGKGKYMSKHVHEDMTVEGTVQKLTSPMTHEAYQTIYQFLHRGLTIYAPNEASAILQKGYTFSFADSIRFPVREFLSRFFARQGYKDGFHGLMLSLLMACYHFAVFAYLWENEKFKEDNKPLAIVTKQLKDSGMEFRYWIDTAKLEKTKNPASKILLKAKRKLGI